jgi:hypothetical protein
MVGVPDNEIATAVALTVDATVRTVVLLEREAVDAVARRSVGDPSLRRLRPRRTRCSSPPRANSRKSRHNHHGNP